MFGREKPEVLVVGAGPVGLTAALRLVQQNVDVAIVDKEWRPAAHSYALALHPQSLQLLDELGVLEEVLARAYRVRTIGLYDGAARRAGIQLTETEEKYSFVAVLRQDVLESVLEKALKERGVRVLWNHQASDLTMLDDHVNVTVERLEKESMGYAIAHTEWVVARSERLGVPFVVGADGHRSDVRHAAQIDYPLVDTPQHFAVFEFKTNIDLGDELRIVLDDETTNVLWPLPDGYCRWSFQLKDFDAPVETRSKDNLLVELGATRFPVLAEENLRTMIEERAPWFTGSVDQIQWRLAIRFEKRLADAFGRHRMWLAGDAAHMTGPVGVQSMNVGMREARDLANLITGILQGGQAHDELETYNMDRLNEWRKLLGLEAGLKPQAGCDPWLRTYADTLLSCIPASGSVMRQLASQLKLQVE